MSVIAGCPQGESWLYKFSTLTSRSPAFLKMVSFQTSAFESRHRWKLASSTLFFNGICVSYSACSTLNLVRALLCFQTFASSLSYYAAKSFHISHDLCTGSFSRHNDWPAYLWLRLILGRVFFLTYFFLAVFSIFNLLISCCATFKSKCQLSAPRQNCYSPFSHRP